MQSAEDLAVRVTSNDGDALIMVAGEMDAFTRSRLVRATSRALSGSAERVTVDVSGLSFIDATSYAALVDLTSQAESEGKVLRFRNPSRTFLRARELIDRDLVLKLEE